MLNPKLQAKLDLLPKRTGVYKFFADSGELLYVGKALNLRSRVRSYFSDQHADRPHIIPMIEKIADIEILEADNEVEALVLESAIIKEKQPQFNILQKDGKSYAYIYISTKAKIPKVSIVRSLNTKQYKKGRLFGPYPSGRAVRQVFKYIRKIHPFCTDNEPNDRCLYYHMGLCPGPYFSGITRKEYMDNINSIIKFLNGRRKSHVKEIEKEMRYHASQQNYEKAAELRDKVQDLKHLGENINISYEDSEKEYLQTRKSLLQEELSMISSDLGLKEVPERIECYDISNLQGEHSYGSMTVNINGQLKRDQYRIFKIKTVEGPNDFASLKEVLDRRFSHMDNDEKDESLNAKPDLVLIDGGKGQLSTIKESVPEGIKVAGISKGKHLKRKGQRKIDQFWALRGPVSIQVKVRKPRILVNLRDEAHRFAITHHRKARSKTKTKSILDEIDGVGAKTKKALLKNFGSVSQIKKASIEKINEVINNKTTSQNIYKKFH